MKIRQGDLLPPLIIDCTDDGAPIDLTEATSVRVVGVQGVTEVIDDTAPATTDQGQVTHTWVAGETETVGRIFVNVEAVFAGKKQTFPPYGSLAVDVTPAESGA